MVLPDVIVSFVCPYRHSSLATFGKCLLSGRVHLVCLIASFSLNRRVSGMTEEGSG